MDATTIPSKEIIYDLLRMKETVRRCLGNENEFEPLLGTLLECNIYEGDNFTMPTLKDLVKLSGIKYDKVRKQLKLIYGSMIAMTEKEFLFTFHEVEYIFYVMGDKNNLVFNVKSLPVAPRVGENIDLPYFRAYLGTSSFFVDSIDHEFEEDKQSVVIRLLAGYFNPYWHYRKAQAVEEGELGLEDLMNLKEYEMKSKLKIGPYRFWQK